jgi:small-conductance mechanosensitive channel
MQPINPRSVFSGVLAVFGFCVICQGHFAVQGQVVPTSPLQSNPNAKAAAAPAPSDGVAEASVASPAGPISLESKVKDSDIRKTLDHLLSRYPGVRSITAEVDRGAVTLDGQAEDDDVRAGLTQIAQKVEGVRLVLNRMKTDAQVMTPLQLGRRAVQRLWQGVTQNWVDAAFALAYFLLFLLLARVFSARSETWLAPFIKNVMLRSVAGSVISSLLVLAGVLMGLSLLNLTHMILSIVGLASMVGLAIGFAFRDITENFIASILLGTRRPFQIGDYIQVAGREGVVKTLNTRATVLVTLEGNHIRIPNNIIYKEIMVNSSASPISRGTFDVVIPYEASAATAMEAMSRAICDQEGVLADPPARVLVDGLETNGVRLRAFFWMPVHGVDGVKLLSDLRLKGKLALQAAGIAPPPMGVLVSIVGRVPVDVTEVNDRSRPEMSLRHRSIVTPDEAEANLRIDQQHAETLTAVPSNGEKTVIERVLGHEESQVSEEGTNLLPEPEKEEPDESKAQSAQVPA